MDQDVPPVVRCDRDIDPPFATVNLIALRAITADLIHRAGEVRIPGSSRCRRVVANRADYLGPARSPVHTVVARAAATIAAAPDGIVSAVSVIAARGSTTEDVRLSISPRLPLFSKRPKASELSPVVDLLLCDTVCG